MTSEYLQTVELDKAKKIVEELFTNFYTTKIEKINIERAHGRVLAENVYSPIDLPPFDRATRDGFAVKASDTFGANEENPVKLKCIENIEAGYIPKNTITEGHCARISTGALIPSGSDAVVMVEFTEKKNNDILIYKSVYPGQYIAKKGSDIKKGELLLKKNTILSPDKIGALSAVGIKEIPVYSKPKIAVISTGNELIELSENLKKGKIFDVNSYSIAASIEECGAKAINLGIVKDNYEDIKNMILKGLKVADIVVISGGTSAGKGDIVAEVIDDMGEVILHGIAMKPGKPTIIGKINSKIIIGLPGYPVSALIVFRVLIAPILCKITKAFKLKEKIVRLPISQRFHSTRGRLEFALVSIENNKAVPILKDSGAIASLAMSDGYIEIPKNVEIIEKNEKVEVKIF
ncbi:molybdenum cofactor synthesis domain protein [Methanothermus fervidus DSM 2088]|uniref:molybdopterin molybdotransferase n=1 Tax=Methanothermus fervidus (strain ATCC 43054 / DSM 2088 / JCM 10308 / V24 S) TaxID=523846 RepID=E3GXR7_METFV|nr:gephyrin-like molybdotransferase Glp [Methanothermus fervidus]ADP77099.1 molybdenum cofactor synthesis domain protein [Methanothermus fervidus DSM 2088]